jgi:hypothetical protein
LRKAKTSRAWLLDFARDVRSRLEQSNDPLLDLAPRGGIKEWVSDSDGWCAPIGWVKSFPGELQVWLDDFARAGSRRVSVAFKSTDRNVIEELVAAGAGKPSARFDNQDWSRQDGIGRMNKPLPAAKYGHPVAEFYGRWNFYSMYFARSIEPQLVSQPKLVTAATDFLQRVVDSATEIVANADYPAVKNRATVRTHLHHERNRAMALQAKRRDKFLCHICRVSFRTLYGKIGTDFAEVHHIFPLGSAQAKTKTTLSQLVTVCANCHRMLHKLKGRRSDLKVLKKAFTGKWPSPDE